MADFSHNSLRLFILTPTLISVDLSHNALIDLALDDEAVGCPSLEVLKLSHNPACQFAVDFTRYPKLTHVDLCGTIVNHPFPLPKTLVDLVLATPEFQELAKGTVSKVYATDVGYSETIGTRDTMEDALVLISGVRYRVYAVVDGHGGSAAAHLIARFFKRTMAGLSFSKPEDIRAVCAQLDSMLWKKKVRDGATSALVVLAGRRLSVAHLGDSRVGTVVQLTIDHKASERREMELIKKNGSFVAGGRLEGHLAVSRAFGDFRIRGGCENTRDKYVQLGERRLEIGDRMRWGV
jgi:hypothetical protein